MTRSERINHGLDQLAMTIGENRRWYPATLDCGLKATTPFVIMDALKTHQVAEIIGKIRREIDGERTDLGA